MIKTRVWAAGIAVAVVVLAALSYRLAANRRPGQIVQIVQDGVVVREIDLSRVREEYSFTLEAGGGGYNKILVQPGQICVTEADCPDQICVMQGWLSDQSFPIACLPHRLIIMIKDSADAGSNSGSDAVAR